MIIYLAKFMKKKENMKNVKMYQHAINWGYNHARYNLVRGYRDGLGAAKDEQTRLFCSLMQPKKREGFACIKIGETYENEKV